MRDCIFGHDDYTDIDSIVSEILVRIGQISRILDKHASPSVQGPSSAIEKDPVSGEWTLKMGNYNEEGKFLPWSLRIAQNLVIDHFRKSGRVKMINENSSKSEEFTIFSVLKQEDANFLEAVSKSELEHQMIHLLDYLPESQKEIIEKRIFQDLSFKEIADAEGISINTALGRMRYALINMRKMIEKHQLVTDI